MALGPMTLRHACLGRIEAIYLRPARGEACISTQAAYAHAERGLEGDRSRGGTRQLTLIQAEHMAAIAAFLGRESVDAALLRRNLVVSGLNLLALKALRPEERVMIRADEALIEVTGSCAPCSRMEEALGPGGYNALRGHGGVTAVIIESGWMRTGGSVSLAGIPKD